MASLCIISTFFLLILHIVFPLQAYNIFPKIVACFPGKLHDMFSKVNKVKTLFKLEAEARMKALDLSSPPKDFIEAFLLQMEMVKSLCGCSICLIFLFLFIYIMLSTTNKTLSHSCLTLAI